MFFPALALMAMYHSQLSCLCLSNLYGLTIADPPLSPTNFFRLRYLQVMWRSIVVFPFDPAIRRFVHPSGTRARLSKSLSTRALQHISALLSCTSMSFATSVQVALLGDKPISACVFQCLVLFHVFFMSCFSERHNFQVRRASNLTYPWFFKNDTGLWSFIRPCVLLFGDNTAAYEPSRQLFPLPFFRDLFVLLRFSLFNDNARWSIYPVGITSRPFQKIFCPRLPGARAYSNGRCPSKPGQAFAHCFRQIRAPPDRSF